MNEERAGDSSTRQARLQAGRSRQPGRRGSAANSEFQYHLLRQRIVDGIYPPGTRLLETVVSKEQGVSRTPVRSALEQLAEEGLVERKTRGYIVRYATAQEILDLYDIRIPLEATAAGLTAERRTDLDLARLRRMHAELQSARPGELSVLNNAFHHAIIEFSRNKSLIDLLEHTLARITLLDRPSRIRKPDTTLAAHREHADIVEAIADRDAEAARAAQTRHLTRTRDVRIAVLAELYPQ